MVLFFTHIPFVVNHTINATPPERLQQHFSTEVEVSGLSPPNSQSMPLVTIESPHEVIFQFIVYFYENRSGTHFWHIWNVRLAHFECASITSGNVLLAHFWMWRRTKCASAGCWPAIPLWGNLSLDWEFQQRLGKNLGN